MTFIFPVSKIHYLLCCSDKQYYFLKIKLHIDLKILLWFKVHD